MNIIEIAVICHEVNRAYCESIDDHSQKPWDDCEPWQRESAINGVQFHLDNPDAGPEASHENWLKEKVSNGWVFGQVKNPEKKEHPCIMSFTDLPPAQKAKDYVFRSIVHNLKRFIDEHPTPVTC